MKKHVARRPSRKFGHRWVQNGWFWTCRSCQTSKRSVQVGNGLQQWQFSWASGEEWTDDCPMCCNVLLKR